jgi:dephospho-CoA kinase
MKIYGLTGGIGCGKSEVGRRFAELGIPVIDADVLGHELIAPGGQAESAVVKAFGPEIMTDGIVDRAKLGAIVFADNAALLRLNSIIHPLIGLAIAERCAALVQEGNSNIVVEATLIAENGDKEPWMNGLILVFADEATRLGRLIDKRGMTPENARRRIDAQSPPERKAPLADWIIRNESTVDELRATVDNVAKEIMSREG